MSLGNNNPKILGVGDDDSSIEFGSKKYKPFWDSNRENTSPLHSLEFCKRGAIQGCEPVPRECKGNIRSGGNQRRGWLQPVGIHDPDRFGAGWNPHDCELRLVSGRFTTGARGAIGIPGEQRGRQADGGRPRRATNLPHGNNFSCQDRAVFVERYARVAQCAGACRFTDVGDSESFSSRDARVRGADRHAILKLLEGGEFLIGRSPSARWRDARKRSATVQT